MANSLDCLVFKLAPIVEIPFYIVKFHFYKMITDY